MLCFEEGKSDPTLILKDNDVTVATRHMKERHADKWVAACDGPSAVAATAAATTTATTTAVASTQRTLFSCRAGSFRQVTQTFTLPALQRLLCASLLLISQSQTLMNGPYCRLALGAIGGLATTSSGHAKLSSAALVWSPPDRRTSHNFEKEWLKAARDGIRNALVRDKILPGDPLESPVASHAPLGSIGFDGSSTKVDGYAAFSLNFYWLCPLTCARKRANVAVEKFAVSSGDGNAQTSSSSVSQTASNIAAWVTQQLKKFGVVPESHIGTDLSKYVYAACTDNASAEVCAVVEALNLFHQPCVCHSLELAMKAAADPPVSKQVLDAYKTACADAVISGADMPTDPRSLLILAAQTLANLAGFLKKSTNTRRFLDHQLSRGITQPLGLVSRSQTRWHMVVDMFWRAVLLRGVISYAFDMAGRPEFTSETWSAIHQSLAVLYLLKKAVKECQSRDLLIGAHFTHVFSAFQAARFPRKALRDFTPTAEFLNVANNHNIGRVLETTEYTTESASGGTLQLGSTATDLHNRLNFQLRLRTGQNESFPHKRQLNSLTTGLAISFDPAIKSLVLDMIDPASGKMKRIDNNFYTNTQKDEIVARLMQMGKALEADMRRAKQSVPVEERSPPPKQSRNEAVDFVESNIAAILSSTQPRSAHLAGIMLDNDSEFVKEFKTWRERRVDRLPMAMFWAGDEAKIKFPLLRRLFLSVCSVPPGNDESERDFSAMSRLLSPLRRGRISASTCARKMFLFLNRGYWHPCPEIKRTEQYKRLLEILGIDDWDIRAEVPEVSDDSETDDDDAF